MDALDYQADVAAIGRIPAVPTILDVVCRTTGMGFAAVARVTEDRWIACGVRDDIGFGLTTGGELPVETTICHEIRQSGEPVIINHADEDIGFFDHQTPVLYGFQSYISMPIILADGTFFGTLCAIDPKPAPLNTPETIGMFKLFAELIAFHLDAHAKLDASERKLMEAEQTAQLREQFIAVLGHDLRNPLNAISAVGELLERETLSVKGMRLIGMMRGSVTRMSGMIDNVLDFARGRLGGGLTLTLDAERPLVPVLLHVVEELRAVWPDRRIATSFGDLAGIACDHAKLGQLLSNLLGNALAHGAADEPVTVAAWREGEFFLLSVTNRGSPIPAETLPKLFHPFFRGGSTHEGLGLGLYITSEIARAHCGRLDVESTTDATCFTFRMPIPSGPLSATRVSQ